jgi:ADP-heptose:LPS heptosyltransferase/Tfp pilus assembly protein PilF
MKQIILFLLAPLFFIATITLSAENLETEYLALAKEFYERGDINKTIACYQAALAINPCEQRILYNTAYLLKNSGAFAQALPYYDKLLAINPSHSDARQGRSHALLGIGQYAPQTWEDFEHRWSKPRPDAQTFTSYMHTHAQELHGKTVLITSEFDFGDTFQFIRYGEELKSCGAHVIAVVQKQLAPLISRCPYLDQVIPVDTKVPAHDLETVLMSLPWAFNTTLETIPAKIPYLYADETLVQHWHEKLSTDHNFKIGICWHGNAYTSQPLKKLVDTKSIPLSLFSSLARIKNISIYSLQKTSGLDECAGLPADFILHRFDGQDFDESHGAFMDTAALMKNLDLVITIDTSIAHLAGGLGVPTWLLLAHGADWRWLVDRDDSPWYPGMRLFRQPKPGDWQTVMVQVAQGLQNFLSKKSTPQPEPIKENANFKKTQTSTPIQAAKTTKQILAQNTTSDTTHTNANAAIDINTLFQEGLSLVQRADIEQALTRFNKIHARYPTCVPVLFNIAGCYRRLGALETAADFYEKALILDPKHTDAAFGLALVRHTQGDMKRGWELFNLWRKDIDALPKNPAQLAGKRVLVKAEWGLGDMINFIRYAQNLKGAGASVFVQSHKPLVKLLSRCPYIDQVIPHGTAVPETDYQLPLLYLPTLFKTTEQTVPHTIPYIFSDPSLITYWKKKLAHDTHFKVGICWDMGHYDTNLAGWKRAIPLEFWHEILRTNHVSFYCLQKEQLEQLASLPTDITVYQFGSDFDTNNGGFMDSAAVMKNLDLIITVDTAIAHLAGALGVPVWMILPYHTDYRWMRDRTDTPWYPSMRLFRSAAPDDWMPVTATVARELQKEVQEWLATQTSRDNRQNPLENNCASAKESNISSYPNSALSPIKSSSFHFDPALLGDSIDVLRKRTNKFCKQT